MAYYFEKSYVRKNYEWSVEDISAWTIAKVISDTQSVRIILNWENNIISYSMRLRDNKHFINIADKSKTITQWLAEFTEDKLILTDAPNGLMDAKSIIYHDLSSINTITKTGNSKYGEGQVIPRGLDNDYCFRNPDDVNPLNRYHVDNMEKNCLFAINGYIRPTVRVDKWLHIVDGARIHFEEKYNVTSVIDFTDIGGISKYKILPENVKVLPRTTADTLNGETRVLVRLNSDADIFTERMPIVVLGGHIHVMDNTYEDLAPDLMLIKVNHKLAIMRELGKIFVRDKPYEYANVRHGGAQIDTFDVVKYVTAEDSFIVVINNPELGMKRSTLVPTGLSGTYTFWRYPKGIGIFDNGKLAPYYAAGVNKDDVSLNTLPSFENQYLVDTQPIPGSAVISRNTSRPKHIKLMDMHIIDLYVF